MSVYASIAAFLLAMIPLVAGECGVYDRIIITTDGFLNDKDTFRIGKAGDYRWSVEVDEQHKQGGCKSTIPIISSTSSQVNFVEVVTASSKSRRTCFGRYELIGTGQNEASLNQSFTVLYLDKDQETKPTDPYYSFATKVIQTLLKHQYYYLHMSHFFKTADHYLPNAAQFFRGYVDRSLEIAENGIKYTLDKKETLALMHGVSEDCRHNSRESQCSHYPMYDLFHDDKGSVFPADLGFKPKHFFTGSSLKQAFKQAVHWEQTLMKELVEVSILADNICDTELGEYISAEMMPGQRETIKLLESHRQTIKRMERNNNIQLAEVLFDSLIQF